MSVSDEFLINYAADRCFGIDDVIYGWLSSTAGCAPANCAASGSVSTKVRPGGPPVEVGWRRQGVARGIDGPHRRAARNRGAETLYMSCLPQHDAGHGEESSRPDQQFDADDLTGKLVARTPSAGAVGRMDR